MIESTTFKQYTKKEEFDLEIKRKLNIKRYELPEKLRNQFKKLRLPRHLQCRQERRVETMDPIQCCFQKGRKVLKLHKKFTILCVSSNSLMYEALMKYKVPKGISVELHYAKNGLIGYQKFKEMANSEYAYHMIFMALKMDAMDGGQSTRMIRDHEEENMLPRTYIIGNSSVQGYLVKNKCIEIGMDDYHSNPITQGKYLKVVYNRSYKIAEQQPK